MNNLVVVLHLAKKSGVMGESFSEYKGIEVVETLYLYRRR